MRLSNRVALVTGATSSIGKQIAPTLLREGAKAAIADVGEAPLFFAAFEFNALSGPSLVVSHGWFMQ